MRGTKRHSRNSSADPYAPAHDAPDLILGSDLLALLTRMPEWVWRREEFVTFPDAVTCRHEQRVTMRVPGFRSRAAERRDAFEAEIEVANSARRPAVLDFTRTARLASHLPIATMSKSTVVNRMTIRSRDGALVDWAPRGIVEWASWSLLCACAQGVLKGDGVDDPLRRGVQNALLRIAASYGENTQRELKSLTTTLPSASPADAYQFELLRRNATFLAVVRFVAYNWLLLIPSAKLRTGTLLTVTIGYQRWLAWGLRTGRREPDYSRVFRPPHLATAESSTATLWTRLRERVRWLKWRQFMRLGLLEATFAFPARALAATHSYAFEIEAPDGLYVTSIRLLYEPLGAPEPQPPTGPRGSAGGRHARVYARGVPYAQNSTVWVKMVPSGRAPTGVAAIGGLVTALILTVGLAFVSRTAESETSAAAAILLVVPTIGLTLLARPDDHEITSAMFVGVKNMLACSGLCLYTAAFLLLLKLPIDVVFVVWLTASTLAWFFAWLLGKSYFTPRRFIRNAGEVHGQIDLEESDARESP